MNENLIGNENNIIFYEDEEGNSKVEVILKEDNYSLLKASGVIYSSICN